MSRMFRYTVEYEDGHEDEYATYQDAKTIAQRDNAKVIEYEYEFTDSSLVDDFTPSTEES